MPSLDDEANRVHSGFLGRRVMVMVIESQVETNNRGQTDKEGATNSLVEGFPNNGCNILAVTLESLADLLASLWVPDAHCSVHSSRGKSMTIG